MRSEVGFKIARQLLRMWRDQLEVNAYWQMLTFHYEMVDSHELEKLNTGDDPVVEFEKWALEGNYRPFFAPKDVHEFERDTFMSENFDLLYKLDLSNKKTYKILAGNCFSLAKLFERLVNTKQIGVWEEEDFQLLPCMGYVSSVLVITAEEFVRFWTAQFEKTERAKHIASSKTLKAAKKQAQMETIYRELGCKGKGSKEFYIKAMQKTGWSEDYIKKKVKKMINTPRKTDGIP